MKIRTFIEGTKEYHQLNVPENLNVEDQHNIIKQVLEKLSNIDDIVVTFKLIRENVQKNYYTFCTPECTKHILNISFLAEPVTALVIINARMVESAISRLFLISSLVIMSSYCSCCDGLLLKDFPLILSNSGMCVPAYL